MSKPLIYFEATLDKNEKVLNYLKSRGLKEETIKDFKVGFLFGAYDNKNLLGFVCFKELNSQATELAWMAVEPEYKNKGFGTILVNEGLKLLPNKYLVCEVKTLSEIDPDKEYAKTRNFYKKLGFIPLETIDPYPAWGVDNPCQIFVKIL